MGRCAVVTAEQLIRKLGRRDRARLIDVRREEEYRQAAAVMATAVWRDHRHAAEWGRAFPSGQAVVVYCAHGEQVSQAAAALLRSTGVAAAFLEGGFAAWSAAGGATVSREACVHWLRERPSRWVTRERPKIDRIACPWLICRFIDADAAFHFVEPRVVTAVATEITAIPFDIPDVPFSHDGDYCSFDALISRFGIVDPVLPELATIVRGADTARLDLAPQCAGLLAVSLGLTQIWTDDPQLLEHGIGVYDALYAWLRFARDETHTWSPKKTTSIATGA